MIKVRQQEAMQNNLIDHKIWNWQSISKTYKFNPQHLVLLHLIMNQITLLVQIVKAFLYMKKIPIVNIKVIKWLKVMNFGQDYNKPKVANSYLMINNKIKNFHRQQMNSELMILHKDQAKLLRSLLIHYMKILLEDLNLLSQ